MQNATVFKVLNLDVSIKTNLRFEWFSSVGCHLDYFVYLKIAFANIDIEWLFSSQT